MVWDTSVSTSKALSALIDCNSFLPEGRRRYRMQTAVSQQDKRADNFISTDVQQGAA